MLTYPKQITASVLLCSHILMSCWNPNLERKEVTTIQKQVDKQQSPSINSQLSVSDSPNLSAPNSEQVVLPGAQENISNPETDAISLKTELKPLEDFKALALLMPYARQGFSGEVITVNTKQKYSLSVPPGDPNLGLEDSVESLQKGWKRV